MSLLAGILLCACQTAGPLPPPDLSAPGWQIWQGQAVWQPGADKPEIVGDVLLSFHPSEGALVQFSKTLPILSARTSGANWFFEATAENKSYSGRGDPPRRIVWLQLLRVVEGRETRGRWRVARPSPSFIVLEDDYTGERLELHLQSGGPEGQPAS